MYNADRVLSRTDHSVSPAGEGGLRDSCYRSYLYLSFLQEVKYEGDRTGQTENPIPDSQKNLRNQKRKAEEVVARWKLHKKRSFSERFLYILLSVYGSAYPCKMYKLLCYSFVKISNRLTF